jgi:hypothetical protein
MAHLIKRLLDRSVCKYRAIENKKIEIATINTLQLTARIYLIQINSNVITMVIVYYPTSTRRHGNFAGVHTLLRIILSSNSAVLINIITGVSPPHFDFFVFYVLCQC